MSVERLDLTDTEWMEIINRERDGLPPCCANISALRDALVEIARNDSRPVFYSDFSKLRVVLGWCFPEHGIPSPVIQKIIDQVEFVIPAEFEHEKQTIE